MVPRERLASDVDWMESMVPRERLAGSEADEGAAPPPEDSDTKLPELLLLPRAEASMDEVFLAACCFLRWPCRLLENIPSFFFGGGGIFC